MNALRTASGHPVSHIAFPADGATFAAAQPHSGVTLHDRITGQAIRTSGSPRIGAYRGLVYFDDGTRLAASTPKGLELFDLSADMAWARYHRLGKDAHLAAAGGNLIAAWPTWVQHIDVPPRPSADEPTGRPIGTRDAVFEGLSPDGRFVVWTAKKNRMEVGEVIDGQPVRVVATADVAGIAKPVGWDEVRGRWRQPGPDRVVFAPRGDRFAVRTGKSVSVFDMPCEDDEADDDGDGKAPRPHGVLRAVFQLAAPEKWPKDEPWVPPVAFTPTGRGLLVRRPKQQVQLWDVNSVTMVAEWNWKLDAVTCLAVAPDGLTAVAGGRFGKVVVWDLE